MFKRICMFLGVIISCVCLRQESYADIIECESWGPTGSNSPDTQIFVRATNALTCAKEAGLNPLVGIDCDGILSRGNSCKQLTDSIVPPFLALLVKDKIPFFCMTSMPSCRSYHREYHFTEMGILHYFRQQSSSPFIREYDEKIDKNKIYFVKNRNSTVFTSRKYGSYIYPKGNIFEKLIKDGFIEKPDFFIFIDDRLEILGNMQDICDILGIYFLGIHCTAYSPD